MTSYDLLLVEVTHLDENIAKDTSYSRSAVSYNRWNFEPLTLNFSSGSQVGFDSFVINRFPEDVSFYPIGSENQDAILTAEVGSIGDDDGCTGRDSFCWKLVILQLFSDPIRAFLIISCELTYGSSLKYKTTPDCFLESVFVVLRTETLFASQTEITSTASSITLFDYFICKTIRTVFLRILSLQIRLSWIYEPRTIG